MRGLWLLLVLLWGQAAGSDFTVRIDGDRFLDEQGRQVLFKGINLAGSSKQPARPRLPSHRLEGLFDPAPVSFVDRPFPLGEADEHFGRIRSWGFNLIRLVVTWEALQPARPGVLDSDYVDYLDELVARAAGHGLWVLIDPHQDVWSRFSGGDGAPRWTFHAVGMEVDRLAAAGATVLHAGHQDYPHLAWPANYSRFASATMFSLFFGGRRLAPETRIEGKNVQDYLQHHFFAAFGSLAVRLGHHPNLLGYDSLNEPHPGWIGMVDLRQHTPFPLRLGPTPTPWQSMLAAAGMPQEVERWAVGLTAIEQDGRETINPGGVSIWQAGVTPVWQANGVWSLSNGQARLERPDHFQAVDFNSQAYGPFLERWILTLSRADPDALVFVQPAFHHDYPPLDFAHRGKVVAAPHFYDQVTLVKKWFFNDLALDLRDGSLVFGRSAIGRMFADQVHDRVVAANTLGFAAPVVIGETGIPMDLNGGSGLDDPEHRVPALALDRSLSAIEAHHLGYVVWNYTPDNEDQYGDQWNRENLSLVSRRAPEGRALRAAARPAVRRLAGEWTGQEFDVHKGEFTLRWRASDGETVISVPPYYYRPQPVVEVSAGRAEFDANRWLVTIHGRPDSAMEATIRPSQAPGKLHPWGWWIGFASVFLGALGWVFWRRRVES